MPLERALTIYREIGDRQGEGNGLLSLGGTYSSLGNYAKALEYNQQRLDLMRKNGDILISCSTFNLHNL